MRSSFLYERRQLRDRPRSAYRSARVNRRRYKGDLKQNDDNKGLETSSYDVGTLHIPYGPGWDARRIDKLVYQTVCLVFSLAMLIISSFNPLGFGNELCDRLIHFLEKCLIALISNFQSQKQRSPSSPSCCFLWYCRRSIRRLLRGTYPSQSLSIIFHVSFRYSTAPNPSTKMKKNSKRKKTNRTFVEGFSSLTKIPVDRV